MGVRLFTGKTGTGDQEIRKPGVALVQSDLLLSSWSPREKSRVWFAVDAAVQKPFTAENAENAEPLGFLCALGVSLR
jgi:hypothetical protein